MNHPTRVLLTVLEALTALEDDLEHVQPLDPQQQRGALLDIALPMLRIRRKLRTLNHARDLTNAAMNCVDNSHDHRGHGPREVTTQDPVARLTSKSRQSPWTCDSRQKSTFENWLVPASTHVQTRG